MKFNIKAFFMHLLFSLVLVSCFAFIILTLWYPSIWSHALGGYDLFIKIVLIDLFAGPICMGLVYKSHKRLREKILDVSVITLFQLAFLGYGLWVLYESRPAFIVFANDRYFVHVANEIEAKNDFGKDKPFDHVSLKGPVYAAVDIAKVSQDDQMSAVLTGGDITDIPRYYEPLETQRARINEVKKSVADLPDAPLKIAVEAFLKKKKLTNIDKAYWLPARHRFGVVTMVLYDDAIEPVGYIDIDPYDK